VEDYTVGVERKRGFLEVEGSGRCYRGETSGLGSVKR